MKSFDLGMWLLEARLSIACCMHCQLICVEQLLIFVVLHSFRDGQ